MGAPRRGVVALLFLVASVLVGGAPGHATVTGRAKPVFELTVSPGHFVARGHVVAMAAAVRPLDAAGVVRFYDGAQLLAQKPYKPGSSTLFTTRSLETGEHLLRVVLGRGTPFRVAARSRVWVLVVTPVPTIDDQNIVARIPPHKPVKVLPARHQRPPVVRPPHVGGTGQGRGGLAYTGVALLGLLLLAATLLATGSAAWWAGRDRARRTVRFAGALLTLVGGVGVGVIYVGGGGTSQAQPGPAYPTALPPDPPDERVLVPAWPSGQPRPTLSVLGPAGQPLADPILLTPGQQITVVAGGFAADDGVVARPSDAGPDAAQLQADTTGTVRFLVVIPRGAAPGLHTISLAGSRLTAAVAFTVVGRGI